jgi:TldD protein
MNFRRREFIRLSGITVAGTIIAPSLLNSCKRVPVSQSADSYLSHFEVTPQLLQKVISTAMEKGGDYADLYFEHTILNNCSLEDGKVNSASSNIAYGVGIRVVKGDQTGYAYSENVTEEAMLKAARTAANIADSQAAKISLDVSELTAPNYYAINKSWEDTSIKDKVPFIQRMNDNVFAADARVTKVNAVLGDSSSYILFYNSDGTLAYDYRPWRSFMLYA